MRHAIRAVFGVVGLLLVALAACFGITPGTPPTADLDPSDVTPVAAAPTTVWSEDFEAVTSEPQSLMSYAGSGGAAYTASPWWRWLEGCNAWLTPGSARSSSCAYTSDPAAMPLIASKLAAVGGGPESSANHALTWYSLDGGPDGSTTYAPGQALLTVNGITLAQESRFLRLGLDAASTNCQGTDPATHGGPLFRVEVADGPTTHTLFSQIDPCADGSFTSSGQYGPFRAGRYLSATAPLIASASPGITVRDDRGAGYNDGGLDNLQLLDVSPTISATFATSSLAAGATTTLTLTIANTSDGLAKDGFGFTGTLPAGLQTTGPATSTCGGSPGTTAGSVALSGGALPSGTTTCTVSVPVTGSTGTHTVTPTGFGRTGLVGSTPASMTVASAPAPAPSPTKSHRQTSGPAPAVTTRAAAVSTSPATDPTTTDPTKSTSPVAVPTESGDPGDDPADDPTDDTSEAAAPFDLDDGGKTDHRSRNSAFDSAHAGQSIFTGEVPDIWEIIKDPPKMAAAIAMGMVWTLLLVISTSALEKAVGARIDEWSTWVATKLPGGRRLAAMTSWMVSREWWAIAVLMGLNTVMLAYVDPHFGFDWLSIRMLLSITVAEVLAVIIPLLVVAWVSRVLWKKRTTFTTSPWGLVVGMIGVVVSRLIGFLPGLLGGSTMEVEHDDATPAEKARIGRAKMVVTLLGAGVCLTALTVVPGTGPWQVVFLHDALVAGSIIAILGPFIDLMPVGFFGGALIFKHLRWSWMALMTIAAAGFCLVVLPKPTYWLYMGDRAMWWVKVSTVVILLALVAVLLVAKLEKTSAKRKATRAA